LHKTNVSAKTQQISTQKLFTLKKTMVNKGTLEKTMGTTGELEPMFTGRNA